MKQFDAALCKRKATIRKRLEEDKLIEEYLKLKQKHIDWSHFRYPEIEPLALVDLEEPPTKRTKIGTTTN